MMETDNLIKIDELCEMLVDKPSKATVYKWTSNGLIPFIKKGRTLFFDKEIIKSWDNNGRPHLTIV